MALVTMPMDWGTGWADRPNIHFSETIARRKSYSLLTKPMNGCILGCGNTTKMVGIMLKLSKKVEYALISILYMGRKSAEELTTSRELAEKFNIPAEILGKVLQNLARKGLIRSVQGVKGGYRLPRSLDKISLAEVIVSVEGPIQLVKCIDHDLECDCEQFRTCNIRSPMEQVQSRLFFFFQQIKLNDLGGHHWPIVSVPVPVHSP